LTGRSDPCNIKSHWWGDGAAAFHSNPLLDTLSASRDRAILGSGRVAALDLLYQYSRDQRVIFTSAFDTLVYLSSMTKAKGCNGYL